MVFDRIVEDSSLSGMLGRNPVVDEEGQQLLSGAASCLANVTPKILKVDLERLAELTHRDAKVDDLALHDLIIDRATRQQ
ncbi:unnamed protein product [Phytophthora lilii]|uniref:Unnamed protein product n=1 Tax=Phytophthora lilii TaxID=2077276 RepID=A0A9W6XFE9_9STRA|nr:unnamed protein product [Phytophthora lilii]